jgi:hypothetical protein
MPALVPPHVSYDIPPAYARVAEPGGILAAFNKDGSRWRPAEADLAQLGVHILTSPTDELLLIRTEDLRTTPIRGGVVFSRATCSQLHCLYEAAFVAAPRVADTKSVVPEQIVLEGRDEQHLRAATRAIRFTVSGPSAWGSVRLDHF